MLLDIIIFLLTAVITVPVFSKLRLGSVLGYLFGGVLIGPWGLGLIQNVDNVFEFSELGVVLLLFIIGLELTPKRLWVFRRTVFGLGGLQVITSAAGIAAIANWLGLTAAQSLIIGFGLSLSSTAFAIQIMTEQKLLNTHAGRKAFGILLFQDLAVVPMLAVVPLLDDNGQGSFDWTQLAIAVAMIAAIVIGGRYVLNPVFRLVAVSRSSEIFTAATLLVVLGVAWIAHGAGLSMALGAFLAGILLAESEFRHQLEAEIQPFRGLLMGLFFLAVGMKVNITLLIEKPVMLIAFVASLMVLKALLLFVLCRVFGRSNRQAVQVAGLLAQGGEFAFVLFGLAESEQILGTELSQIIVLAVTMSMALTPLFTALSHRIADQFRQAAPDMEAPSNHSDAPVIIAGFGRVGQIVGKVLAMKHTPYIAVDSHPEQIQLSAQHGYKIYYGDPTKAELLRAAGADSAKLIVVTLADPEESIRTIEQVLLHFPNLKLVVRARNRQHVQRLLAYDVDYLTRETFESSLAMGDKILQLLGLDQQESHEVIRAFRRQDKDLLLAPIKPVDVDKLETLQK